MLKAVQTAGRRGLGRVETLLDRAFEAEWNPFNYLGALTIYFFWVVLVSGIYIFILFETSIFGAYQSIEYMTHEQWWLGGIMRSLHRYASDAAVVTLLLHMVKEFVKDRYRGPRWFSWFTGVPLLWMVFPLGITGYWLVWDQLAQYVAIASSELLDWLPIFTDPMARNFLTPESLSDRFFTLMAFLHLIGFPIFLIFGIWFHLLRLSGPKVNPPKVLAIGFFIAMLALSLVYPAVSQAPADLTQVPGRLGMDWFYLPVYPLIDILNPGQVWSLLVGFSMLLTLAPWLPMRKRPKPAVVDLPNCNGCGRCVDDCPFNAVDMQPRTDGTKYSAEAVVDNALCTGCGICAGACPTSTPHRRRSALVPGIQVPDYTISELRDRSLAAVAAMQGERRVIVYGCEQGPDLTAVRSADVATLALPCIGMLPPSFIDFMLSREHVDGVVLTGCRPGDCHHRYGNLFMDARVSRKRDPHMRWRVPGQRVKTCWAGVTGTPQLVHTVAALHAELPGLPRHAQKSAESVDAQSGIAPEPVS